jgi:hypothetical protein
MNEMGQDRIRLKGNSIGFEITVDYHSRMVNKTVPNELDQSICCSRLFDCFISFFIIKSD